MKSSQAEGRIANLNKRAIDFNDPQYDNSQHTFSILKHRMAVQKALGLIEAKIQDPPTLGELATFSGLSRTYFSHVFKEVMGITLRDYLIQARLERAKDLLGNIDLKIKKIAYEAGFCDPNYFCRFFKKKIGLNPTNWRLKLIHMNKNLIIDRIR